MQKVHKKRSHDATAFCVPVRWHMGKLFKISKNLINTVYFALPYHLFHSNIIIQ